MSMGAAAVVANVAVLHDAPVVRPLVARRAGVPRLAIASHRARGGVKQELMVGAQLPRERRKWSSSSRGL
eukprot:4120049-Pyramimonas_sp.AAC.1